MAPINDLRPVARALMRTQPDARLVTLVREGSDDAFAEVVRRHRPGLIRLARSMGPGERAEDVVQDGLVRAWRALRSSSAEIDLRPWLTTIVRNRARSAHASARDHEPLGETIDGLPPPPDVVLMREELRSTVSAVNSLPSSQREALVRSALRGESHEQIAGALTTSPGAVRQLIFRARRGLRETLGALIPLPLLRQLGQLAPAAADGGGAAAAIAAASAGGGSAVVKGTALLLIGAAAAGSGIALETGGRDPAGGGERIAEASRGAPTGPTAGDPLGTGAQPSVGSTGEADRDREGESGDDPGHNSGPGGGRDDSSGPGSGDDAGSSGPGSGAVADSSGPGSGGLDASSGPGSGDSLTDSSGPGSGDSLVDSSGPGSGGPELAPVSDSSSGSGSSGSGSSGRD